MRPEHPIPARPTHTRLLRLVTYAVAVVALPREATWPFAIVFAVALARLVASGVTWRWVVPRLGVEIPFLVFALVMPFVALGERVAVGPLWVSAEGVWAAWGLLAKGTTCVVAALALAATTTPEGLVAGLQRLRVPTPLVEITAMFARYVHVTGDRWAAMARAQAARGLDARTPSSWPALARGLGVRFVRSYEQGERVHRAMLSRGYSGAMPVLAPPARASASDWGSALWPTLVALGALLAWTVAR